MIDINAAAEKLFPSMVQRKPAGAKPQTATPEQTPARSGSLDEQRAAKLYGPEPPYKSPFDEPAQPQQQKPQPQQPHRQSLEDAGKVAADLSAVVNEVVTSAGLEPNDISNEFGKLAGELRLDKAGVEKLMDLHQRQFDQFRDGMAAKWEQETIEEFGRDADYSGAREVLRRYGDQELLDVLNETGLWNNKALIRFLRKISDYDV